MYLLSGYSTDFNKEGSKPDGMDPLFFEKR